DPVQFEVAGFTQLSIDHLDYHDSVDNYFEAKSRLFVSERCRAAVILIDDEWGARLLQDASSRLERVYALTLGDRLPDGVEGWRVELGPNPGDFTLHATDGSTLRHSCAMPGAYNIANAALAIAMALVGGVDASDIPPRIDPVVPGRMEVISQDSTRVIVDFAHNADSLEKALSALRPSTQGRLIAVTGTAGDRDATKRFAMGEATAANADVVVITDDDPHTEDPAQIRR